MPRQRRGCPIGPERARPNHRLTLFILGVVAAGAMWAVQPAPPAWAATSLAVTIEFPDPVTVGQSGLPAVFTVANGSTGAQGTGNVTLQSMTLVPSCSTLDITCASGVGDPDVFTLSPTAMGAATTACAGVTFNVNVIDPATGRVQFAPVGGPVVLAAPSGPTNLDICRLHFTFSVKKAPSTDAVGTTSPGIQTYQVAFAEGQHQDSTISSGAGADVTTVMPATPTITTFATANAPVGQPITDTATVSGLPGSPAPTGTVTFSAFAPGNPTCSGTPVFTSEGRPLAGGPPPTATAGPFTAPSTGTYRWTASYSGDVTYTPVTSPCNDADEASVVERAASILVTQATPSASVGQPISDTATISTPPATPALTGSVTFSVFGPDDPTCTAAPAFTARVVLTSGSSPLTVPSSPFTPMAPGTYRWVAAYSGDANFLPAASPCDAPNESTVVSRAQASITSLATAGVTVGTPITDTATVTTSIGLPPPTGTVTFTLFGPDDPTCAGTPLFTSSARPLGGGPPPSAFSTPFTPTSAGTYHWIATYSGDSLYLPRPTPCNDANETSIVARATPSVVTHATGSVPLGQPITDVATVSGTAGVAAPTGTVTFRLYAPDDPTCDGTPAFTSTSQPLSGGPPPTAMSAAFTATLTGEYRWIAEYSGDVNYVPYTAACNQPDETSTVVRSPSELRGELRVTTTPPLPSQILVDGVPRDTYGLAWLQLPPGPYTVSFTHVEGWTEPAPTTVTVTSGAVTTVDGAFVQRGFLRVVTEPAVPGTISVDGMPRNNWGMWTDLPTGSHQVCFGPVAGFDPPGCQTVTLDAGLTTLVTGHYVANAAAPGPTNYGELRVVSSPAVPTQILIDGVPRDSWGLTWLRLTPGTYTVSFTHVEGWTEPAPQTVTVADGQVTTVTGAFVQRGSLRVATDPARPGTISVDGIPRDNWGMWTDLPAGPHQVCFGPVPGFTPPACQDIVLTGGTLTTVTGTYS